MGRPPLSIVALNPVACGSMLARIGDELVAIVIVKATFTLAHERSAWPIDPEPLVEIDQHVADHPTNSLVAATDFVPALPRAGVVLHATAHAPGGRPVTEMAVRVAVFQDGAAVLNKHLFVVGDRERGGAPAPFARMPIVYERAFGGPAIATNPAGVGAGGGAQPNVVDPRQPERPAGFGPIARTWAPRAGAMRRLDGAARDGGVTIYPAGTSFEAFVAAPADQRIEPLRGDEWIVLDGLHPKSARIQTQLPFARALARYLRPGERDLVAIDLVGDTLTIDTDRLVASVVWRGRVAVSSVEEAGALRVFAALEIPTVPIAWPEPIAPLKEAVNAIVAEQPPDPLAESIDATTAARRRPTVEWPSELPDTTSERDVTAIRAAIAAEWGHAVDLDRTADVDERAAASSPLPFRANAPATLGIAKPIEPQIRLAHASTGTVDVDQRLLRQSLPFAAARSSPERARAVFTEADATPDSTTAPASDDDPSADVRTRAETRARAGRSLGDLKLAGADLTNADLAGADLRGVDLGGARLAGAKLTGANLGRADLTRAVLDGATLAGADLTEARLDQARGHDARLVGAIAARASFARGDWEGADFSDAELDAADFTAASLAGARFVAARLLGARLVDVRGASATFDGARAAGAAANGALFSGASFRLADLDGAIFDGAELADVRFDGARLEVASLVRAAAARASFAGADLRGAKLVRLAASDVDLRAADLRGADLRGAKLPGARIEEATLRDAQAMLVDLSGANLARSDLSSTNLREADLSAADLTDARLDRADLRDANLNRATLTRSSRQGAKMQGARMAGVIDGPRGGSVGPADEDR